MIGTSTGECDLLSCRISRSSDAGDALQGAYEDAEGVGTHRLRGRRVEQDEPARVAFETHLGKLAMDFGIHAAPLDRALLAAMATDGRRH